MTRDHSSTVAAPPTVAPSAATLRRASSIAARIEAAVERWPWFAVGMVAGLYLVGAVLLASRKRMWNDELWTYNFARLPTLGDYWRAMLTGVEQTPPTLHMVTRLTFHVLGAGPISIRVPEILAFLLALICVFEFVRFRSSVLYGLVAMLVPLVTVLFDYAFEARAYALALGFSALALLGWQRATAGRRRALALVALAAGLCVAVASHYHALLVLVPLVLGEVVRSFSRRRVDKLVWAAFAFAFVPFAAFAPFVRAASNYSATNDLRGSWLAAIDFYGWLLRTDIAPRGYVSTRELVMAGLALGGIAAYVLVDAALREAGVRALPTLSRRRIPVAVAVVAVLLVIVDVGARAASVTPTKGRLLVLGALGAVAIGALAIRRPPPGELRGVPVHEIAALVGFFAIPLAAVVLGKVALHGVYADRYGIAGGLGLCILLPLALYRLGLGRPGIALLAIAALSVLFVAEVTAHYRTLSREARYQRGTIAFADAHRRGRLPVAVAHPLDFFELSHYADPRLRRSLFYLASPKEALAYLGSNNQERGLVGLRKIIGLHVVDYSRYVATERPFLALTTPHFTRWNWTFPALRRDGRRLRLVAEDNGRELWLVRPARDRAAR